MKYENIFKHMKKCEFHKDSNQFILPFLYYFDICYNTIMNANETIFIYGTKIEKILNIINKHFETIDYSVFSDIITKKNRFNS